MRMPPRFLNLSHGLSCEIEFEFFFETSVGHPFEHSYPYAIQMQRQQSKQKAQTPSHRNI